MQTRLIPSWWTRLRHGRGFGIHSPFAFDFIINVLREKTPYYCYSSIPDGKRRMVFRLVNYFNPRRVWIIGDDGGYGCAVAKVSGNLEFTSDDPDFVIVGQIGSDDLTGRMRVLSDVLQGGGSVYFSCMRRGACRQLWAGLLDGLDRGMSFCNGSGTGIIVGLRHLPRQDFKVRF